jgi:flagellar hook-length control protein FliK
MRIAMKPEALGEMRVRIVMDRGTVNMDVRVESAHVKAILESHAPQLKEALLQQGLKVASFDVNVNDNGNNQNAAHQGRFGEMAERSRHHAAEYGFAKDGAGQGSTTVTIDAPSWRSGMGGYQVNYLA